MKKQKISTHTENYFIIALFAFLAALGLNVDLSLVTSLEDFRIEGFPLEQRLEDGGILSGSMEIIASFFSGFSGNSVLWLCIFFALCYLFHHASTIKDKRIRRYSLIAAAIFSLLYIIGFSINKYDSLIAVTGSGIAFLKCIIAFTGITLTFYALLKILFNKVIKHEFNDEKLKKRWIFDESLKAFYLRIALIIICWLPYFIVSLPGVIQQDTVAQIAQAMGDWSLSNHHPIFMTGLFGIFIRAGLIFGSANAGVFLYSIFQMLTVAASFSYISMCLAKQRIHIYIRLLTLLFFALYPAHAFYGFTMWKDTLFSVVFMLLTLKTIQMISQPANFFSQKKNIRAFALLCIAMFLTRNNGLYITIILLPLLLLMLRKYWKNILTITAIFAAGFIILQTISTALEVQKGSIGEALSIPLQQIARTVKYHGAQLPEDDKALISAILPYEQLPELYNPITSDPVKFFNIFNEAAFRADPSSYLKLWARLMILYPGTYLEAFLCQTHGYWYPDTDTGIRAGRISPNDYNIYPLNIVPTFVENAVSGIFIIRVFPVISMFLSIGFAVWITAILALTLILKKQFRLLFVFIPALLLWLTCIASPVSGMYRYIYGLFLIIPLLTSVALQDNKWYSKNLKN